MTRKITPENILIVEDDHFFRQMYSDILRGEGYQVETAAYGGEALEKLSRTPYVLIISDLILPDMSGLDVLARAKAHDASAEVIMVTGHANTETAIFALKNGARDYLIKPLNATELKHSVALCLEQRRLLDENLELKKQINMFQASQAIANCQDQERVCKLIFEALSKETGLGRGIALFANDLSALELKEHKGIDHEAAVRLAELPALSAEPEGEGAPFFSVGSLAPDPSGPAEAGTDQVLSLFVRSKIGLQGVVHLFGEPGSRFPGNPDRDLNLNNLHYLVEQSSLALENAARFSRTKNLLNIDELTGLYNYRYLDIILEREVRRAERYNAVLSVLFLDIDFFKEVNDRHGHLVGSRVLKEVGALLKKSVREEDTVIRYGGDEYTIVLVETGAEGALAVAERIRKTIENNPFRSDQGERISLTASLGCASFPDDTRTKKGLLELADRAMYKGKAMGKNVVYCISRGE